MGKEQELLLAAQSGNLLQIDKILGKRQTKASVFGRSIGPNCQDQNGYTPLHHASLNGRRDAVESLLKYGASVNIPDNAGSYPLHLAAWSGHADVAEILLNRGPSRANANEKNNNNETAIHLASQYGHNMVVVVLLECHADPNIRNLKNESSLDLASQFGRLECVNSLLTYYPTLVKRTTRQNTPIHLAAKNGHYNVVKLLLDMGMSVNIESDEGTPLHVAALYGKSDIVKLLLQSGVDINIHNKDGSTVMDLLASNPSQRSSEITAWIYTYLQNKKQSSSIGGKSRSVSDARLPEMKYDEIPPPRPISEFSAFQPKQMSPSAYDEVPLPLSLRGSRPDGSSVESTRDSYDQVPSRSGRGESQRMKPVQLDRQMSYDRVPIPRPMDGANSSQSLPNSIEQASFSCYDEVPIPIQANNSQIPSTYDVVHKTQSTETVPSQYQVPVTSSQTLPMRGLYDSVKPSDSSSLPPGIPSAYGVVNIPPRENTKPASNVQSIYSTVQISERKTTKTQGPNKCPLNARRSSKDTKPRKSPPESSYEFLELPARPGSLDLNERSSPISIPAQDRSGFDQNYDTITSPPRRVDPIGAPESPYKNLDSVLAQNDHQQRSEQRIGDGLKQSDARHDPDGAKDYDLQRAKSHHGSSNYENFVLPTRSGSFHNDKIIYQNSPVASPTYEYNLPNPKVASLSASPRSSRSSGENYPSSPEVTSHSGSLSGSPSSTERRTTDYENVELPSRSSSNASSLSNSKPRNAYEILPPHILHGPMEPGSPKPDHNGKIAPPIPRPYRESKKLHYSLTDESDEYCTLREVGINTTQPNDASPPCSPPSPTTAGQMLFSALQMDGHTTRESLASDDQGSRDSETAADGRERSRTLKYENVMFDKSSSSNPSTGESQDDEQHGVINDSYRLSVANDGELNEYEEWKKIERFMNILGEEIGEERKEVENATSDVGKWLNSFHLGLYESYLLSNGFDDIEFLAGGILDEQDLLEMGVLDPVYRRTILDHVDDLSCPPRVGVHGFQPKTVEEWLNALHLEQYLDLFHRKGYSTMERVKQMWELELESILAIHTLGHRKRILSSLPQVKRRDSEVVSSDSIKEQLAEIDVFGGERKEVLDVVVEPNPALWRTVSQVQRKQHLNEQQAIQQQRQKRQLEAKQQQQQLEAKQKQQQLEAKQQLEANQKQQQQQLEAKQKQQQQQRKHEQQHEQKQKQQQQQLSNGDQRKRSQSSTHWSHPPEALLKGNVNYTTKYLGSHFIKDVIGESSTVEACRKMRMSTQKLQKIPAVILSISVTGVRFIDARSRIVISSHYIHNISYCTQDLEDRTVFAYIAKDQKTNAHYCHVFKANSPAVSDEIVLTIGQAFELAYEQYANSQYTSGGKC